MNRRFFTPFVFALTLSVDGIVRSSGLIEDENVFGHIAGCVSPELFQSDLMKGYKIRGNEFLLKDLDFQVINSYLGASAYEDWITEQTIKYLLFKNVAMRIYEKTKIVEISDILPENGYPIGHYY